MGGVCRRIESLLTRCLAGELPADLAARVQEHLVRCPACRSRCHAQQRADAALTAYARELQAESCPSQVWQRVQAELGRAAKPRLQGVGLGWVYGLTAVLLVLAVGWRLTGRGTVEAPRFSKTVAPSVVVVKAPIEPPPPPASQHPLPVAAPAGQGSVVETGGARPLLQVSAEPQHGAWARRAHRPKRAARSLRLKPIPVQRQGNGGTQEQAGPREELPVIEYVLESQREQIGGGESGTIEYVLGTSPLPPGYVMESDGIPVVPVSTGWGQGEVSM